MDWRAPALATPKQLALLGVLAVSLATGCGGAKTLSDAELAKQVSERFGPDRQGSTLVECYTPNHGATFNRVCYDPLAESGKLYLRLTGQTWCVVWPREKRAPMCH